MGKYLESLGSLNIAGAKAKLDEMTTSISSIKAESDIVLNETVPRLKKIASEITKISSDLDSLYSQLKEKAQQYDEEEARELARRLAEQNQNDSDDNNLSEDFT